MKTSACKSCGAAIVWACVASGKRAPFDLAQTPDGEWGIDDRGPDPRAEKIDRDVETQPGHKSHFATCPHAKAWRRKKPPADGGGGSTGTEKCQRHKTDDIISTLTQDLAISRRACEESGLAYETLADEIAALRAALESATREVAALTTERNAALTLAEQRGAAYDIEQTLRVSATSERDEARAALEKSRRTLVFTYRDVLACTENMAVPADVRGVNLHDLVLGLLQDRADARDERDAAVARVAALEAEVARLRESLAAIAEGECEQTVRYVGAHLETCEEEMPLNNSKWCGACIARRALAPPADGKGGE